MCTLFSMWNHVHFIAFLNRGGKAFRSDMMCYLYMGCVGGEKYLYFLSHGPGTRSLDSSHVVRVQGHLTHLLPTGDHMTESQLTPTREDNLSISTHLGTHLMRRSQERNVLLQKKLHVTTRMDVTSFYSVLLLDDSLAVCMRRQHTVIIPTER